MQKVFPVEQLTYSHIAIGAHPGMPILLWFIGKPEHSGKVSARQTLLLPYYHLVAFGALLL